MTSFIDARNSEVPEQLQCDICIVGAGAAGISLAVNLADSRQEILVIESGGYHLEGDTQALYQGAQKGLPYYDLTACRLRYFGGTTNHWGGYCRPNDPADYAGRPELDVPPWPVGPKELDAYIETAARQLGFSMSGFDPAEQLRRRGISDSRLLERSTRQLQTKVFQLSKRLRFQELYKEQLEQQRNLRLVMHANVTAINVRKDGASAESLAVRTLNGRSLSVRAKRFVLACHAIENARLLLASDDVVPGGLGNAGDKLGRYFMEHAYVVSGLFFPNGSKFPDFYNYHAMRRINLNLNLSISEKAMRERGILQYYCRFVPIYGKEETAQALRTLSDGFWEPADMHLLRAMGDVLADFPAAVRMAGAHSGLANPQPLAYELDHRIEQAPNPNSRISLSQERDALGNRRADIQWELRDLDHKTFEEGRKLVVQELSALGLGRCESNPLTPDMINANAKGHFHHIGTTRMSDAPKDGVVDRNCKVHGVENLYVAGSAVFPTSGYSGPTMMLIAFAIRLAAHLKSMTA